MVDVISFYVNKPKCTTYFTSQVCAECKRKILGEDYMVMSEYIRSFINKFISLQIQLAVNF